MSLRRAILKALSWRVIATSITFLVSAMVLAASQAQAEQHLVIIAGGIALLDMAVKILSYIGHELLWDRVPENKPGDEWDENDNGDEESEEEDQPDDDGLNRIEILDAKNPVIATPEMVEGAVAHEDDWGYESDDSEATGFSTAIEAYKCAREAGHNNVNIAARTDYHFWYFMPSMGRLMGAARWILANELEGFDFEEDEEEIENIFPASDEAIEELEKRVRIAMIVWAHKHGIKPFTVYDHKQSYFLEEL